MSAGRLWSRAPDGGLEGQRGQMVALVDHDQAVVGEERFEIVYRLEALDHCQVDDAGQPSPAAAALTDLLGREAEEGRELRAPLVEQRLAVSEDERRQFALRDERARDHRLAGSGRRDKDAVVVCRQRGDRVRLQRRQLAAEYERQLRSAWSSVVESEPASRLADRVLDLSQEPAWEVEVSQVLLVATDQPRRLMGRESQPLALAEERVVQRGQMLELGQQRGRQVSSGDRQVSADRARDLRRQPLFVR